MRFRIGTCCLLGSLTLVSCSRSPQGPAAQLPERETPAFAEAARLHASEVEALGASDQAGLWVVEDSAGQLVASGVLPNFPTTINSVDYEDVVPGALGLEARAFGIARTHGSWSRPALRVAYVTIGSRS